MDIKTILAKLIKGETLTDEEKQFAENFEDGKIPHKRLNEEIDKRKNAEAQIGDLTKQLSEIRQKLEEAENRNLSADDKAKKESAKLLKTLQDQVEALTKERDEAKAAAQLVEFNAAVKDLAMKHSFADAEYLGYKLKTGEIDLTDETAVSAFFAEMEKTNPSLFTSSVRPGGGTGGTTNVSGNAVKQKRLDELNGKPELSPREVAEVIQLSEEINAGNG